ncbi:hypothetical protein [Desulfatiglans anilini]|uniref:hypothetical protein n=1 Tax=Desulfatiglans anilini TaxID=90728 RepID=UPI0004239E34|nr:hypothetical protein [Desulfatiglans anilini]
MAVRTVMMRLLALQSASRDGPWHTLFRELLERADHRALLAEIQGDGSARVSEPSAAYDVSRMPQGRLFD